MRSFNTQPPEGGCSKLRLLVPFMYVSIHSRLKAAAMRVVACIYADSVSIHSRLKAAGPIGRFSFSLISFQYTAA